MDMWPTTNYERIYESKKFAKKKKHFVNNLTEIVLI